MAIFFFLLLLIMFFLPFVSRISLWYNFVFEEKQCDTWVIYQRLKCCCLPGGTAIMQREWELHADRQMCISINAMWSSVCCNWGTEIGKAFQNMNTSSSSSVPPRQVKFTSQLSLNISIGFPSLFLFPGSPAWASKFLKVKPH